MSGYDDLARALVGAIAAQQEKAPKGELAYLGFRQDSGSYSIVVGDDPKWLWVRIVRGEGRTVDQAFNEAGVYLIPDLPVRVVPFGSHHKIVGYDADSVKSYLGNLALNIRDPALGTADPIKDRRLLPGLVHSQVLEGGVYGLGVYIEPFTYRWNETDCRWPGGLLDVSGYLPSTEGTYCWVKIGIDPATNLPVAVAGEEYSIVITPSVDQLIGIPFGSYIPLAGLRLSYGQTAVSSEGDFIDLRPWWTGASSGVVSELGWQPDTPPIPALAQNDEFNDATFSTTRWTEYDPSSVQSISEAGTTLALAQDTQSSVYLTGIYQELPAGDFTITAKVKLSHDLTDATDERIGAGIVLWDDATDSMQKAILLGIGANDSASENENTQSGFGVWQFTDSATEYDGSFAGDFDADTYYYLRVRHDSDESLYMLDWSTDGMTWQTQNVSEQVAWIGTPSHMGVGMMNRGLGETLTATFDFFRYRALIDGATDPVYGANWSAHVHEKTLVITFTGVLDVAENPLRFYNTSGAPLVITRVLCTVDTAPYGGDIIVDVHKNGTTIFTDQAHRPVIADGEYSGDTLNIDVPNWEVGQYLQAHIDQCGPAGGEGRNLVVHIVFGDSGASGGVWPSSEPATDYDAIHKLTAGEIAALTEKETPVAADLLLIEDSAASNAKKRIQIGNLPLGAGSLDDLSDVDTTTTPPTDGQALVFDDGDDLWKPGTVLSALPDHDHSGDAGDGGTFDAANLTSGAATDGHVLTADGAGGAAWESLPALADHDHSGDAGDGGTFDAANLSSGSATDGYVLTADGAGGTAWEAPAGGATELDDLTDVDTTTTPPTDGQALVWDDGLSLWVPGDVAGGGAGSIGARVYNNAAISIPNGAVTTLTFNSERYDTDNIHDTVTNTSRLTCRTAGVYVIFGHAQWATKSGGIRQLTIRLNGTTEIAFSKQPPVSGTTTTEMSVGTILRLDVDDYVELTAYQDSGSALNINYVDLSSPEFAMQLVGAGGATGLGEKLWTFEGGLEVTASPLRIYNSTGTSRTIEKVFISVNTAPTGAAIIVDVHKDGTTIFTTQSNRPQIAASSYTGESTSIDVATWGNGEYLTVEIDQVGSSVAGANLVVQVLYS